MLTGYQASRFPSVSHRQYASNSWGFLGHEEGGGLAGIISLNTLLCQRCAVDWEGTMDSTQTMFAVAMALAAGMATMTLAAAMALALGMTARGKKAIGGATNG